MKLVPAILDSSSQTSSGVRNLETTHFPLYSRLGAKGGAVECRPSRDFREARFWIFPVSLRTTQNYGVMHMGDSSVLFAIRLSVQQRAQLDRRWCRGTCVCEEQLIQCARPVRGRSRPLAMRERCQKS